MTNETKRQLLQSAKSNLHRLSDDCVECLDVPMIALCIGFPHCKDTPDRVPLGPVTAKMLADELYRLEFTGYGDWVDHCDEGDNGNYYDRDDYDDSDDREVCEQYFEGSHDDDLLRAIVDASGADLEAYADGDEELNSIIAVHRAYGEHPAECECNSSGAYGYGCTVEAGGAEYSVMTDDDADLAWDECLESYLDDGGIVEGADSPYFDRDAWKRDASYDGRAMCLSGYDHSEYEEVVGGTYYAIFRTN